MLQESGFTGNHWELLTCIKILSPAIISKFWSSCDSSPRVNVVIPDHESGCVTARLPGYAVTSYRVKSTGLWERKGPHYLWYKIYFDGV